MKNQIKFKFLCQCPICQYRKAKPAPQLAFFNTSAEGQSIQFCQIVRKLVGYPINISEILYFREGQFVSILYSYQGIVHEKYKSKERMSMLQVKLFLDQHRRHSKAVTKKPVEPRFQNQEAALCVFNDGNSQVLTESELQLWLISKKNAHLWHQISYIQNYIQIKNFHSLTYRHNKSCRAYLRAKRYVQCFIGEVLKTSIEYISQQEELLYEKSLPVHEYLHYITTKIVAYLRLSKKKAKLLTGTFEFIQDDQEDWTLFGVRQATIKSQKLELRPSKTNSHAEDTLLLTNRSFANQLEKEMYTNYETTKQQLGLKLHSQRVYDSKASGQAFSLLYPDEPFQKMQQIQRYRFKPQNNIMFQFFKSTNTSKHKPKEDRMATSRKHSQSFQDSSNYFLP